MVVFLHISAELKFESSDSTQSLPLSQGSQTENTFCLLPDGLPGSLWFRLPCSLNRPVSSGYSVRSPLALWAKTWCRTQMRSYWAALSKSAKLTHRLHLQIPRPLSLFFLFLLCFYLCKPASQVLSSCSLCFFCACIGFFEYRLIAEVSPLYLWSLILKAEINKYFRNLLMPGGFESKTLTLQVDQAFEKLTNWP